MAKKPVEKNDGATGDVRTESLEERMRAMKGKVSDAMDNASAEAQKQAEATAEAETRSEGTADEPDPSAVIPSEIEAARTDMPEPDVAQEEATPQVTPDQSGKVEFGKDQLSEEDATDEEKYPYVVVTDGAIIGDYRFDDGSEGENGERLGTCMLPAGYVVELTRAEAFNHQKRGVGLREAKEEDREQYQKRGFHKKSFRVEQPRNSV